MIRSTIKKFGRPVVASLAYFGGYCSLAETLGIGRGARILSYHAVDDKPANSYAVSSADFEMQMGFLVEHFSPISMEQLALILRMGKPVPRGTVAVTFDDGYSGLYSRAYPILKQLGVPATIFLPVAFIGAPVEAIPEHRLAQTDFLNWEQVREMTANGITFGSHTMNHFSLTQLQPNEIWWELEASKSKLEQELGAPVSGFAYPFGTVRDVNREIERLVAATGYEWAVTGTSGVNNHRSDRYALARTKVERDDGMYVFTKALRGALDPWVLADKMGGVLPRTAQGLLKLIE